MVTRMMGIPDFAVMDFESWDEQSLCSSGFLEISVRSPPMEGSYQGTSSDVPNRASNTSGFSRCKSLPRAQRLKPVSTPAGIGMPEGMP